MILIDTHILIWWLNESPELTLKHYAILDKEEEIGISAISIWEIAKLVENKRLQLAISVDKWIEEAISQKNIIVLPLEISFLIKSPQLPGVFHKDPADQMIVATSRVLDIPLLTNDSKILNYSFVKTVTI